MTSTLRQAIQRAVRKGEEDFKKLERATGVKRQSLMRFARSEQSLRLDMADKLARHFGYRFDCHATPDMDVRDVFEHVNSHYIEHEYLREIFDEKYLQHTLYAALWHRYSNFLEYECQYEGFPVRNEIDLAIPWELVIEVINPDVK